MTRAKNVLLGATLSSALIANFEPAAAQSSFGQCLDDLDEFTAPYDDRTESSSFYYFEKEKIEGDQGIKTSIKTAIKSGEVEDQVTEINHLSRMTGFTISNLINGQFNLCASFETFNDIPQIGKDRMAALTRNVATFDKQMLTLIKEVEAIGRQMIKDGTPPVPEDEFVRLFR